jgi:hypothetical protein
VDVSPLIFFVITAENLYVTFAMMMRKIHALDAKEKVIITGDGSKLLCFWSPDFL